MNEHLQNTNNNLSQHLDNLIEELTKKNEQKENIEKDISSLKQIAQKTSQDFLDTEMKLAEEKFDRAMEQLGSEYEKNKDEYEQAYLNEMAQCTNEFVKEIADKQKELKQISSQIVDYKSKIEAIIEAQKRSQAEKDQKKFYSVVISDIDIIEIQKLREVGKTLRDQDLLNKIIWKAYYEKPTQMMCGRVVGSNTKTGVYRIVNQDNGMAYIGQAVDIATRFKQHIKRGLGAETPTRNKLYPAMFTTGVENFTFEILEECAPQKLNELERYWIDFYETQSYGYNVLKGTGA